MTRKKPAEKITSLDTDMIRFKHPEIKVGDQVKLISTQLMINKALSKYKGIVVVGAKGEIPTQLTTKLYFTQLVYFIIPDFNTEVDRSNYINSKYMDGCVISDAPVEAYLGKANIKSKMSTLYGKKVFNHLTGLYYFIPDICLKLA